MELDKGKAVLGWQKKEGFLYMSLIMPKNITRKKGYNDFVKWVMYTTSMEYLEKMETYLLANFPNCILTQIGDNKRPAIRHAGKTSSELWEQWKSFGKYNCQNGVLILLKEDLIVVDVDDLNCAYDIEHKFPEFINTAIQETQKGKHYFFKRTLRCDKVKLFDGARLLKDDLPIDFKTKCSTGTGGCIAIRLVLLRRVLQIGHRIYGTVRYGKNRVNTAEAQVRWKSYWYGPTVLACTVTWFHAAQATNQSFRPNLMYCNKQSL
jgi:hypothetical protein